MSDPGGPRREQLPEIGEVLGRLGAGQVSMPAEPGPRDVVPVRREPPHDQPELHQPAQSVAEQPLPERRRGRFSRRRTTLALAATGLMVVGGGIYGLNFEGHTVHEQSFTLPGSRQRVEIDAGTRDVHVTVGQGSQIVASSKQGRFGHCEPTGGSDGDTTTIDVTCGDSSVSVPAGVEVVVKADTGDVTLSGGATKGITVEAGTGDVRSDAAVKGPVAVTTTTGDVHLDVASADGTWVRTTTGQVDLRASAVKKVSVSSTTGDVSLDAAADVPGIDVSTTTGDVRLGLSPERHYAADVQSGAGHNELGYRQAPATDGTLVVRSQTGDVSRIDGR